MTTLRVKAPGLTIQAKRFKSKRAALASLRGPLLKVGTLIFQEVQRNFDRSGHDTGAWARLATSTAAQKARLGFSPKPLLRTGDLRQRWDISMLRKNAVRVKSRLRYSAFHQFGTRKMPARPMLPSERRTLEIAKRVLRGHVRASLV